ncbi:hypothetical protein C5C36_16180 [Rathayibacter sp. AY1G1]|nr:hypothetical protein C5C36_16180 [Rathayibacter sp. AY1G1]
MGVEAAAAGVLSVFALINGATGPGLALLAVTAGAVTIGGAFWKWATKPKTGREKLSTVGIISGALLGVGLVTGGAVEKWLPGLFVPIAILAAVIAVIGAVRGVVKD